MDNINYSFLDCNSNTKGIFNEWEKYSLSNNKISVIGGDYNYMVFIV